MKIFPQLTFFASLFVIGLLPAYAQAENQLKEPEENAEELLFGDRSLMYLPEALAIIHEVLEVKRQGAMEAVLQQETPAAQESLNALFASEPANYTTTYTYPQIYLDSIMYHTPQEWVLWLNGQKVTAEYPEIGNEIKITKVTPAYIHLSWSPVYKEHLEWKSSSKLIDIDEQAKTIAVVLKPNQTFSTYAMNVYEGRVAPVTILQEKSANRPTQSQLPKQPPASNTDIAPQVISPASASEQNTGFGGLLNRYNNLENN